MKLQDLLEKSVWVLTKAGLPESSKEAKFLLERVLGLKPSDLRFFGDREISPLQEEQVEKALTRRAQREPLAYILGEQEFFGRSFCVAPSTLIPRPETEELVEMVLPHIGPQDIVWDIGTGTGAILLTLARLSPARRFFGTDAYAGALELARENQRRLLSEAEKDIVWAQDSDFSFLGEQLVQEKGMRYVLVANLPYIPSADMAELDPEVTLYEPHTALDGGPDGTVLIREMLDRIYEHCMGNEVSVFLEVDPANIPSLLSWCQHHQDRVHDPIAKKDLSGHLRFFFCIFK